MIFSMASEQFVASVDKRWTVVRIKVNLVDKQSRQANNSASIAKRAKERFCNSKMVKQAQQEAKLERC